MGIIIDLVIIAIMALCIFIGYKRGILGVIVNLFGFLIAIVAAVVLYNPISNFVITQTDIQKNLQASINEIVVSNVVGEEQESAEEKEEETSRTFNDYIEGFVEKEKQKANEAEKEIINNVSEKVSINIVKIVVGIIIFLVVKIALIFAKVLVNIIDKLPIIGQLDKAGGIIYGVIQGLAIVYIGLALISLIAPTMENSTILEGINSSFLGKLMYDNNIILKILL